MAVASSASRWRGVVLGTWAVGLSALLIMGRYTQFIRAQLWPLLLGSLAIVLLFLWAMTVRPAERGRMRAALWLRGGMLMLPLLYMAPMFSKSSASGLNNFAMEKRSLDADTPSLPIPPASAASAAPNSGTAAVPAKVLTLLYVHMHRTELVGQHVWTEGRVGRLATTLTGQMLLYQFVIVCCAADATPVKMTVLSPHADSLPTDQWVRLGGTIEMKTIGTRTMPVIVADEITKIAPPSDPYLNYYNP